MSYEVESLGAKELRDWEKRNSWFGRQGGERLGADELRRVKEQSS